MICQYKVGEQVYLKKIGISNLDNWIPTNLINKPLTIISITKIPLNDKHLWDIELDGVNFCITSDDISKSKPF